MAEYKIESLFDRIAAFIIKQVQEESNPDMSGFQMVVEYGYIDQVFGVDLAQYIQDKVLESLHGRVEVADVICDTDGYDVVLYTAYVPNYKNDDVIE